MANSGDRDEFVFLPLGGIGEIGMNLYLYGLGPEHDRKWLMVDLGVTFPGEREPGIEVITPDIRFIEEERTNLVGILLTHAHEDHFGAIVELWPRLRVPVYATRFTAILLRGKLAEVEWGREVPIKEVGQGTRFPIGPFDVELINMAHSIPETNAIAFRAAGGVVVHTSDWKIDPTPGIGAPTNEARLRELGDEGVDVLVCDSTNALVEGVTTSEAKVAETLAKVVAQASGRVALTTFASNVARLKAVAEAAHAAGRDLVLVGRAMNRIVQAAEEAGYWPKHLRYISEDQFGYIPPDKVVALCTGSQGEPRAALARIANGEHPNVSLGQGDIVIYSSRSIPGNEAAIIEVQNKLAAAGVEIMTESKEGPIHSSGHPRRGELAQMYEWTRPRAMIPMHGEDRHLEEHVKFARKHGVNAVKGVRNGALVRLLPAPVEIIDEAPVGRLLRDGKVLLSSEDGPLKMRRKLSYVGAVSISLVIDRHGDLAADPQAVLFGIPHTDDDGRSFSEIVDSAIFGAFDSIPRPRRKDAKTVGEAVRRSVRAAINSAWGKKTICSVMVSTV